MPSLRPARLEVLLGRDRAVVGLSVAAITGLAWLHLVRVARSMADMDTMMEMAEMQAWGPVDALLLFVMWMVMMVAMMLPAATPMVAMFATVNRRRLETGQPLVRTGVFLAGYVVVWAGFSLLAASLQWGLHALGLLSPTMVSTSPLLGGALLMAAGLFQWTPLKTACLVRCRSPLSFIMTAWREGTGGALVMGVQHGVYCVGCCWLLMALLFVAGVMNLVWIAALAAFVLVEKLFPGGERISRTAGGVLILAGAIVLARRWL